MNSYWLPISIFACLILYVVSEFFGTRRDRRDRKRIEKMAEETVKALERYDKYGGADKEDDDGRPTT